MATIINTPGTGSTEDAGSNLVLSVVLILIVLGALALFFIYGLPMMQNNSNQNPNGTNINVTVPNNTPSTNPPAQ